jgi:hypothetical protein
MVSARTRVFICKQSCWNTCECATAMFGLCSNTCVSGNKVRQKVLLLSFLMYFWFLCGGPEWGYMQFRLFLQGFEYQSFCFCFYSMLPLHINIFYCLTDFLKCWLVDKLADCLSLPVPPIFPLSLLKMLSEIYIMLTYFGHRFFGP